MFYSVHECDVVNTDVVQHEVTLLHARIIRAANLNLGLEAKES